MNFDHIPDYYLYRGERRYGRAVLIKHAERMAIDATQHNWLQLTLTDPGIESRQLTKRPPAGLRYCLPGTAYSGRVPRAALWRHLDPRMPATPEQAYKAVVMAAIDRVSIKAPLMGERLRELARSLPTNPK